MEQVQEGLMRRVLRGAAALAQGKPLGATPRRMRVVETLAVGAKKQLVLVCCDGEQFLVGTGVDSVDTIVRLRPEERA